MRSLAIAIATGWFWFLFFGVGPLTSATQALVGLGSLVVGCSMFALWGVHAARRRRGVQADVPSRPARDVSDR